MIAWHYSDITATRKVLTVQKSKGTLHSISQNKWQLKKSNLLYSVNVPNKILWIIHVFILFVRLLHFINPHNWEFTVM
jgi:hypothetical protein